VTIFTVLMIVTGELDRADPEPLADAAVVGHGGPAKTIWQYLAVQALRVRER